MKVAFWSYDDFVCTILNFFLIIRPNIEFRHVLTYCLSFELRCFYNLHRIIGISENFWEKTSSAISISFEL